VNDECRMSVVTKETSQKFIFFDFFFKNKHNKKIKKSNPEEPPNTQNLYLKFQKNIKIKIKSRIRVKIKIKIKMKRNQLELNFMYKQIQLLNQGIQDIVHNHLKILLKILLKKQKNLSR